MRILVCLLGAMILFATCTFGQVDSTLGALAQLPNKLFARLNSKASKLDDQLTRQSEKYLEKLARREKKIQDKLSKTDSNAARQLFAGSEEKYKQLEDQLKAVGNGSPAPLQGEYLANIDSAKTSLAFLQQNQSFLSGSAKSQQALANASQQFSQLQAKFQQADQIKEYIRQRKQQLKDQLTTRIQALGLNKYMNQYNQDVYYFSEQVRAYREMFNSPDALMKEALVILDRIPAFQNFLKSNAQLGGLFGVSADYSSPQALVGMQTRDQVSQLINGQISGGGTNALAVVQQNLQSAQEQLDGFKSKLSQLGSGGGDIDMPDFKIQNQKTKSFLKRLELGTDLQTTRTNYYFPTVTDIGLSIDYKASNNTTIGVGGSIKIGWGSGIRHIAISWQGASIRSFIDSKLKGSLFVSGGLEYNYETPFSHLQQIENLHYWLPSGLIGLSKIVSLKTKAFKKTKISLLWDFLSYSQAPRSSQPFKFRVGYNF